MLRFPLGHLAAGFALVLATGCLGNFSQPAEPASAPVLDPIAFFTGSTHGDGTLDVRFGSRRTLSVASEGRAEGDSAITLDQAITFADGAMERRTWRMRRSGAGEFTGTLTDAKGTMTARVEGNHFKLRYLIRQPLVYMNQSLYLRPDGRTLLNQATVTVMGLPYARLSEVIRRM